MYFNIGCFDNFNTFFRVVEIIKIKTNPIKDLKKTILSILVISNSNFT